MKRFFIPGLVILIAISLVLAGCAQQAPAPAPSKAPAPASSAPAPAPTAKPATPSPVAKQEVKLDIWGGPFGGTLYVAGFSFMDTLNKTHPWLKGSIIESKGGWDNTLNSDKDKAKMPYALVTSDYATLPDIVAGVAKTWNDSGRPPANPADRKVIAIVGNSAQLMVTFDPNIKRGKDLVGKKVAGWTRGSGAFSTLALVFEEYGITDKDLKSYDGMELKAKIDALSDGLVDAVHMSEPYIPDKPEVMSANLAELLSKPKPLYSVPVTKQEAEAVAAKYKEKKQFFMPWIETAPGHYNKSWPAQGTNVVQMALWVYKEMPEDIQYEIAKTLIEKSTDIAGHGGAAAVLVPSVLVGALPITSESDVAPGALKYYKESGIWAKYKPATLK